MLYLSTACTHTHASTHTLTHAHACVPSPGATPRDNLRLHGQQRTDDEIFHFCKYAIGIDACGLQVPYQGGQAPLEHV